MIYNGVRGVTFKLTKMSHPDKIVKYPSVDPGLESKVPSKCYRRLFRRARIIPMRVGHVRRFCLFALGFFLSVHKYFLNVGCFLSVSCPFLSAASHAGGAYGQQNPYGQQQGGYYAGAQAYGGYQQQPQQPAYGQSYDQQAAYGGGYQQPAYGGTPAYGGMPQQAAYGGYPAAAPPPQPPVAAATWKSAQAADGQIYYYNEKTGETQWDKPAGMP